MSTNNDALVRVQGVSKNFRRGSEEIHVLSGLDLEVKRGDFLALMGPSGSGKSTMMNMLGALDQPTSGKYYLDGIDVSIMSDHELADIRNRKIGFVFQNFNLLPRTSAIRQVELPLIYAGGKNRRQKAVEALQSVGLGERLDHTPAELSGGQQQRVAIARAIVNNPAIIMADEPTGNLDSKVGKEIMNLLLNLNKESGTTLIIVTHDPQIAAQTERVIEISDGVIIDDRRSGVDTRVDKASVAMRRAGAWREWFDSGLEALRMALRSMVAHKLRTFLTMLGIIIGIASVVSVVALGQGSQQMVLENIASIGTNTINIYPGSGFGDGLGGLGSGFRGRRGRGWLLHRC